MNCLAWNFFQDFYFVSLFHSFSFLGFPLKEDCFQSWRIEIFLAWNGNHLNNKTFLWRMLNKLRMSYFVCSWFCDVEGLWSILAGGALEGTGLMWGRESGLDDWFSSSSLRSGYCPYRGLITIFPRLNMLSSSKESMLLKGFLVLSDIWFTP